MGSREPAWLGCFCEAWRDVFYAPSGPWWSEQTVDALARAANTQDRTGRAGELSTAGWDDDASATLVERDDAGGSSTGGRGGGGGGGESGVTPGSRAGTDRAPAPPSPPPPLVGIAALLGYAAAHPRLPPVPGSGAARLAAYVARPVSARRDLLVAVLEEVPAADVPRLLPPGIAGRRWFRLRSAVDWAAWPGLPEWLGTVHAEALRQRGHVDFAAFLRLIGAGGDAGATGLARPTARNHPLARDPTAVGLFMRTAVGRGTPLGLYPGLLAPMREAEAWMQALPTWPVGADAGVGAAAGGGSSGGVLVPGVGVVPATLAPLLSKSSVWAYDYAAPTLPALGGTYTYLGAFVRNAMCAVNDYHRIADT